ncbi:conserved hypothetical protein [Talaromyces stipitatus ATCC 10500]|uniref:DNA-directed RNA polymerase I subunit RPA34.5 n=1 Tax=Talaromyces stipitatus (strain ATCC 10500 / CBS 375.48 / QM 6759 / NRRL 1006) TaxID=441959 RepID=B8M6Z8_TALSN|nr:uncharacterized protein TSTA_034560 [Talaromyces stipitatus ATCC 10500]EED20218.1 conserved hypothetical protein [Talaromyces stipitatus ATCC 10500]
MGKKLSEEVVESDSDESMQDAPETTGMNEKKDSKVSFNQVSTSPSSESESSDESSSETQNNNAASSNRKKTFVPPAGFRPSKLKTQPSAAVSSALSNLEGKQVFHISAPSYLPLSEIKQIDFGKATSGEPILSHKGVDYGLMENSRQQKQGLETLLVYDEKTNTFLRKPELRKIESYNIQEIVRLPGLDTLVPSSTQQDAAKKQPGARPQPKHLRMRFHPVGSSNHPPETVGSSSESEADEPPTFRVPPGSSKEKEEKERKRKTDGKQNGTEEKAKKSKKEKQQPSSQVEAESGGRRDKEKKSSKHRDETSQERRARKEEKKKRKAEKGK